jgi:hypothetical protein
MLVGSVNEARVASNQLLLVECDSFVKAGPEGSEIHLQGGFKPSQIPSSFRGNAGRDVSCGLIKGLVVFVMTADDPLVPQIFKAAETICQEQLHTEQRGEPLTPDDDLRQHEERVHAARSPVVKLKAFAAKVRERGRQAEVAVVAAATSELEPAAASKPTAGDAGKEVAAGSATASGTSATEEVAAGSSAKSDEKPANAQP